VFCDLAVMLADGGRCVGPSSAEATVAALEKFLLNRPRAIGMATEDARRMGPLAAATVLCARKGRPAGPESAILQVGEIPDPSRTGRGSIRLAVSSINPSDVKKRDDWVGHRKGIAFPD